MSELRQDLVSVDWIIVAPERLRRPHDFRARKKARKSSPKRDCPFENLESKSSWPPILAYPSEKNWEIAVIPNKYPALTHYDACASALSRGPYHLMGGVGHHDLVVTRDHYKNFADLSLAKATALFEVFKKRYRVLSADPCILYSSVFFNWGVTAGASLYHPHYQILSLPIIPPDVQHSISGTDRYFRKHGRCPHCEAISYERKEKRRVVAENSRAIAFAPFFSRQPFEMRIFPKSHIPHFGDTPVSELEAVAEVMQKVIKQVRKNLNDPDFNFFIHTAPLKKPRAYKHYHWHIEILPKVTIPAGFELSTGVEINVVDPDRAAEVLRKT